MKPMTQPEFSQFISQHPEFIQELTPSLRSYAFKLAENPNHGSSSNGGLPSNSKILEVKNEG